MINNRQKGFSLIEMLLVMVIVSAAIVMSVRYFSQRVTQLRIDKTAVQMQQILNAGMSYYVANGRWPASMACLRADSGSGCTVPYLSSTFINNPYGNVYTAVKNGYPSFYVYSSITGRRSDLIATSIIGKLPMGFTAATVTEAASSVTAGAACSTSSSGSTTCVAVSSVNIPSQNLSTASAVNFAGVYHHGACVPVPTCPVDSTGTAMTPQIIVAPISVSGMSEANSPNVYPIASFTAYTSEATAKASPANCLNGGATQAPTPCGTTVGNAPASGTYWRVCLQVITERGDVAITNTGGSTAGQPVYPYYPWGGNVTLMAITRCAISNEPSGSAFTVFTQ